MSFRRFVVALFMSFALQAPASAHLLSFLPAVQSVNLGQQASVDIVISGVAPEGLGAYQFTVAFDPAILALSGAPVFGTGLGISLQDFVAGPGQVELSEVSFEAPDFLQPDSFVLATLTFDTLQVGVTPLIFATVADFAGLADPTVGIPADPSETGSVEVVARAVPEPPSLLLLIAGGLAAPIWLRGRRYPAERGSLRT